MTEATAVKKASRKTTPKAASKPAAKPKSAQKKGEGKYVVFATGGKQYRVRAGGTLKIEKIPGEHKVGDTLTFDNVLLVDDGASDITLGAPFIKDSFVTAIIKKIDRSRKVTVIHYKQKSRYFKKYGHRQPYFEVQIDSIK